MTANMSALSVAFTTRLHEELSLSLFLYAFEPENRQKKETEYI